MKTGGVDIGGTRIKRTASSPEGELLGPSTRDADDAPGQETVPKFALGGGEMPVSTPAADYLHKCRAILDTVEKQSAAIERAAHWFAETILAGRMVHVFGSGHSSRIMVEEMWPRYGSFPGFNPIVELSLSFHNLVVGAQRAVELFEAAYDERARRLAKLYEHIGACCSTWLSK
jgi:hypothetical protein